ncbi:hypothetical protein BDZ89DRAFT_769376 [Hymenopellis radicata]|nr:hypothetical protein BDZ89DRAFT_769376 [Hymenopellis radicata]
MMVRRRNRARRSHVMAKEPRVIGSPKYASPRVSTCRALQIATWTNYGGMVFEQRESALKLATSFTTTTMAAASPPALHAYLHPDGASFWNWRDRILQFGQRLLSSPDRLFFQGQDQTDLISLDLTRSVLQMDVLSRLDAEAAAPPPWTPPPYLKTLTFRIQAVECLQRGVASPAGLFFLQKYSAPLWFRL